jgi:hypothetical protein
MGALAMSPSGAMVYALDATSGVANSLGMPAFGVGVGGALASAVVAGANTPSMMSMAYDELGANLYVATNDPTRGGQNYVLRYTPGTGDVLTTTKLSVVTAPAPKMLAFGGGAAFLSTGSGAVYEFSVGGTGLLTASGTVMVPNAGASAGAFALTASKSYAYAATDTPNAVYQYSTAGGALTPVGSGSVGNAGQSGGVPNLIATSKAW